LTVGAGGSFVFDRSAAAATATGRQAVTAIPEPGTLALLFALLAAMVLVPWREGRCWLRTGVFAA
jgi:hypothetical protein